MKIWYPLSLRNPVARVTTTSRDAIAPEKDHALSVYMCTYIRIHVYVHICIKIHIYTCMHISSPAASKGHKNFKGCDREKDNTGVYIYMYVCIYM